MYEWDVNRVPILSVYPKSSKGLNEICGKVCLFSCSLTVEAYSLIEHHLNINISWVGVW
jgi:hypothetical protein